MATKTPAKYRAHYIANSHLDREWTLDFQHTRELTVQFIDSLLEMLARIPEYHFLMDSQTLPLEDYLAVRPEKEHLMRKFVKQGRLHIGPWYSAPDMNTISGESITRNLLVGHRIAKDFGKVMKVGYTPFGFVHISQLPQIYQQFGIDTCFFYRGNPKQDKSEWYWEGPDGTRVLSSSMSKQPRYNYYMNIWRKGQYDDPARLDRRYDWRTGQLPFRLCDEATRFDHGTILRAERGLDKDVVKRELRAMFEREKETFRTHELAFMHGFDTSAPEMLEDKLLRVCQGLTEKDEELFYSSMPRYAKDLKKALKGMKLPVFKGEMKYPVCYERNFHQSYVNIVSTRMKQKVLETRVENTLVRASEPFATVAMMLGEKWPDRFMDMAWRELLKCHPHDTVGGCCIDAIEEDCHYRLRQVESISMVVLKTSLGAITANIDTSKLNSDDILITLFNPSPFGRSEVVTCFVDIPRELNIDSFTLLGSDGKPAAFTSRPTGNIGKVFRDPKDLAMFSNSDEYELRIDAKNLPAMGYDTFALRRGEPTAVAGSGMVNGDNQLENEHLKVVIQPNGSLTITHKQTGKTYTDMHVFEDVGEAGHPWMHMNVKRDQRITSADCKADIKLIENTPLQARFEVKLTMLVPATSLYDLSQRYTMIDVADSWRSDEKAPLAITSVLTLKRGAQGLDVATTVDNQAKNHRLRLIFPTGLKADATYADSPYDVIERRITRDENHPLWGMINYDYPFLKWVDIHDGKAGFAFVGMGLKEYEALDDEKRTLGVTLIRAGENWLCTTSVWDKMPGDLGQCLGENRYQYQLYFHAGAWETSDVQQQGEQVNYPIIPCLAGVAKGGKLPMRQAFVSIDNPMIALSGMKRAESGKGVIVRVYNPSDKLAKATLETFHKLKKASFTNMNEEVEKQAAIKGGRKIALKVGAKKVVTLLLTPA